MKNRKILVLPLLSLSTIFPMLTAVSCGNSNDEIKKDSQIININPDFDVALIPEANSVNFNVGEYRNKLANFSISNSEWTLSAEAKNTLSKLIEKIQDSEKIKYQLPIERFKNTEITVMDKSGTNKTKKVSFVEFLEMMNVGIYKGDWKSNFSSKANYGFNLLDGVFAKIGLVSASVAKDPVIEFNNYIIQPDVSKENPLFEIETNGDYKLVSAKVKTKIDEFNLSEIEARYDSRIKIYQSIQSSEINARIDQINRENKIIAERNKIPGAQQIPLKPVPTRVEQEDVVVPQTEIDKFKKRRQEEINEFSKNSMNVTQNVAFKDGKIFLQKLDSGGNPIQSSWYDFLLKSKNSDTRRRVYITDYLEIILNIEGGNSRTQKILEVPFKSVTQFNNLIKITKDVKVQPFLKFQKYEKETNEYKLVEDWAGKFAISPYEKETKILEFDKDTINSWPLQNRIRFQNPDGSFAREFTNAQGKWKIDDNLKAILFKGSIKSNETIQFKINVVDYSGHVAQPLTPRGFFATFNSIALPVNTFATTFAKKTDLVLSEWLPKGTVVGTVGWTNPPGDTLTLSGSTLDGTFDVKPNGEVVIKSDYLVKPLKTRRVGQKIYFFKEDSIDLIFRIKSNLKGDSEGKIAIPIGNLTLDESKVSLAVPGSAIKTETNYKTWTIPFDQKRKKGMIVVNLGFDTSKFKAEMAKLTTGLEDDSKIFAISDTSDLIYNSDLTNDVSLFYNVSILVTELASKQKRIYKYSFSVNQLIKPPVFSTTKGQDFNKLVNASVAEKADGFITTYGELKNYIKVPNVLTTGVTVVSSNGASLNQYIGGPGRFAAKQANKTLPKRPFLNTSSATIPPQSQFTEGLLTKAFNKEETFTYSFASNDIRNIVLFSMLPKGGANFGPFREFDDANGKRVGFNSIWAGTWTIAEWKKYLEIKYVDSAGVEQKISPDDYLITRIKEIKETDSAPNGDGETQYLQRISITLPTAVTTNSIKLLFKPLPTADSPKYQKAHALSKVLFTT